MSQKQQAVQQALVGIAWLVMSQELEPEDKEALQKALEALYRLAGQS